MGMSLIATLWKCTFSPRLFKIYEVTWVGRRVEKSYEPQNLEKWGDQVAVSLTAICLYVLPLVVPFMYYRGFYFMDSIWILGNIAIGASTILIASLIARSSSRTSNPVYMKFLKTLDDATSHYNSETKEALCEYDFEFWAWPADFNARQVEGPPRDRLTLERKALSNVRGRRKEFVFALPCKFISYVVAHTFAIKMIYPGSISFINWALSSTLSSGRINLIKQGGQRYKLISSNNNVIDTLFIDQRQNNANGKILVITCEGNMGFYENGILTTPLEKGYSVLGWNHPGFGYSTGAPYPSQEENAIDCVMLFATKALNFSESQIILFGWSIGGYTATWGAMNYPSIKSLVLDASFDDVLPLAIMTMSSSLESLVRSIIRDYFNLNIAEQLNRYDGPVLLIRRTEDEIVCTPSNTLSGNRGNMLLTKLLIRRYPHLFSEPSESRTLLARFLSADISGRRSIIDSVEMEDRPCSQLIANDLRNNDGIVNYPSTLGQNCDSKTNQQLIIFLAIAYMKDQPSSHCTPLEVELFQPGWNPTSVID